MRASRLISILTTLQARGPFTAQALAEDCEVSLRTIYRDIEALSAAGIPVYGERGQDGGYRLLDGYRTRLNGLTAQEAGALFLAGLPGPAADLGLGAATAAAELKLMAALPAGLRDVAARIRSRFHLDAPAWFGEAEQPECLPLIANAVLEQRPVRIRYQSWRARKERRVEPLGLVLKGGAWYLVGQVEGSARTYRISRILDLAMLEERFERPEPFDLALYWRDATRRLEQQMHGARATVRLSPWSVKMLEFLTSPLVRSGTQIENEADAEGWRKATMPIGSLPQAASELLRFGAEAEVIEPPELRARIVEIASALAQLYR